MDGTDGIEVSELCRRFWDGMMKLYPEFALLIGHDDPELNRQLDDYSQEGYAKREKYFRDYLREVKSKDRSQLCREDAFSLIILETSLQKFVDGIPFKHHLVPYNIIEGMDYFFINKALPKMRFSTQQDYDDYCSRLGLYVTQITDSISNMEIALEEGILLHSVAMGNILERLEGLINTDVKESPLFKPFLTMPDAVSSDKMEVLSSRAEKLIDMDIRNATKQLHLFLKDRYMPNLRSELSVTSLPNGEARYRTMLRYHTDSDVTALQVHELGKKTVFDLKQKILKVMEDVGFKGSMQEFVSHLESQPEHFCASQDELVEFCRTIVNDRIIPKLGNLFKPFKRLPLIIQVPSDTKVSFTAIYSRPSADGSTPGILDMYPVNMKKYPKYEMTTLMLHEAEPGHHMETSYVYDRSGNLPSFRRYKDDRHYYDIPGYLAMNNAHMEGWGLYSESLGEELGLYDDPYVRFGNYSQNIVRAMRMVVDTGIHALGWSREDADKYMAENSPLSYTRRMGEIDRYCLCPAQAISYTWGCLKIKELRAKAERELGAKFDIKDFHDVCIGNGSLPLNVLEQYVDIYIQETKA